MDAALLPALRRTLEPIGINLVGVAAVRAYDEAVPPAARIAPRWPAARSAIVVGSGGPAFWRAATTPLDAFVEERFPALVGEILAPLAPVFVYPHRFEETPVSFVHLAAKAGLGVRSLLGVLIRPDYGPWFALRAAALVAAELEPSAAMEFDPCPTCAKPCIDACPGGAMSTAGWDVPRCTGHRLDAGDCGDGCHSRLACVYGTEHHYPIEELRHHQAYALETMRRLRATARGA